MVCKYWYKKGADESRESIKQKDKNLKIWYPSSVFVWSEKLSIFDLGKQWLPNIALQQYSTCVCCSTK